MFGFWRLWLLVTILLLGWAGVCYLLTRNPLYLRYLGRIVRWSGGLVVLVSAFWLIYRLLS
ncbi:hypothetical protein [Chromobacterium haemolyticum]|uniref:hypothetical protein n=1 Tax=Chromobacterium haemolyticum TaxID=394935 RepID=UPI0017471DDD|nr:hypothetical protein [Chromobacterium haemolyticum]QOD83178.1 hypothetical protein IEZ30_01375 [Chromobacterium haemolyticum]